MNTTTKSPPAKVRRTPEEIAIDRAEAELARIHKHNAAVDRVAIASKAHEAASAAVRASPFDQKLLAAWGRSLIELEEAGLALAKHVTQKED